MACTLIVRVGDKDYSLVSNNFFSNSSFDSIVKEIYDNNIEFAQLLKNAISSRSVTTPKSIIGPRFKSYLVSSIDDLKKKYPGMGWEELDGSNANIIEYYDSGIDYDNFVDLDGNRRYILTRKNRKTLINKLKLIDLLNHLSPEDNFSEWNKDWKKLKDAIHNYNEKIEKDKESSLEEFTNKYKEVTQQIVNLLNQRKSLESDILKKKTYIKELIIEYKNTLNQQIKEKNKKLINSTQLELSLLEKQVEDLNKEIESLYTIEEECRKQIFKLQTDTYKLEELSDTPDWKNFLIAYLHDSQRLGRIATNLNIKDKLDVYLNKLINNGTEDLGSERLNRFLYIFTKEKGKYSIDQLFKLVEDYQNEYEATDLEAFKTKGKLSKEKFKAFLITNDSITDEGKTFLYKYFLSNMTNLKYVYADIKGKKSTITITANSESLLALLLKFSDLTTLTSPVLELEEDYCGYSIYKTSIEGKIYYFYSSVGKVINPQFSKYAGYTSIEKVRSDILKKLQKTPLTENSFYKLLLRNSDSFINKVFNIPDVYRGDRIVVWTPAGNFDYSNNTLNKGYGALLLKSFVDAYTELYNMGLIDENIEDFLIGKSNITINSPTKLALYILGLSSLNVDISDLSTHPEFKTLQQKLKEDLQDSDNYTSFYVESTGTEDGSPYITVTEETVSTTSTIGAYPSIQESLLVMARLFTQYTGIPVTILTREDLEKDEFKGFRNDKAFIKEGKIFINGTTAHPRDVAHEYAHLMVGIIKKYHSKFYEEIMQMLLEEYLLDVINKARTYQLKGILLSLIDLAEEVFADKYGRWLINNLHKNDSSIKDVFDRYFKSGKKQLERKKQLDSVDILTDGYAGLDSFISKTSRLTGAYYLMSTLKADFVEIGTKELILQRKASNLLGLKLGKSITERCI